MVCSARITELLRKRKLKNIKYLPVKILNYKGKMASEEYTSVHPIVMQDALDMKAIQPSYNAIITTEKVIFCLLNFFKIRGRWKQ